MNKVETHAKAEWTKPAMVEIKTGLAGVLDGNGAGTDGGTGFNTSLTS